MSLRPEPIPPVPAETARVAHAAFPHGNRYLHLRDEIGTIFTDDDFAALFPRRGRPVLAPWRLALVTLMQYAENLSDRRAADAVRSRVDWKYALSLELDDPGFDSTVLCEFRSRLVEGHSETLLLERLLQICKDRKLLRARGKQRTDSTHVLAAVTALNRLQCAIETLRHALNILAMVAPDWLQDHAPSTWAQRYAPRATDHPLPTSSQERDVYAQTIGSDGRLLLSKLYSLDAPRWLSQVPAVELLRQVWLQDFYQGDDLIVWRTAEIGIAPSRLLISSPHDPQARLGKKRTTQWIGYKVHITEACDQGFPHLITHVETSSAPVADSVLTPVIHQSLENKQLLPQVHLVDTGYVDAALLAKSWDDYQVDLLGPTRSNQRWQARAETGFSTENFALDWHNQRATCPAGSQSLSWTPSAQTNGLEVIRIKFSRKDCQICPHQEKYTRAPRRTLTVRLQEAHQALERARLREKTAQFKSAFRQRAGIEGTMSQGIRAFGLRRSRYKSQAKTHLAHIATAAAINLARLDDWFSGKPMAATRQPALTQLLAVGA